MLQYPCVQRRAQAELDSVLGPDCLPTFEDMPALPYLSAIVKECHRWEVTVPFAMPHMLTENDEYRGYFLPSGIMVIPNSWYAYPFRSTGDMLAVLRLIMRLNRAICNDPAVYPDPSVFNPDRFIKDGKIDPAVQDPEMAVFGYGRRIWFVFLFGACKNDSINRRTEALEAGLPMHSLGSLPATSSHLSILQRLWTVMAGQLNPK